LNAVLDIWCEAFPGQMLALSYSHDPDGPDALHAGPRKNLDPVYTGNYDDYLRYSAFDLAMKRPTITFRRDGAGGAVSSNERKLCEYAYRNLRRAPQASEFVGGYGSTRRGGEGYVKWVVDDALSLHPNYVGLLGYGSRDALSFMRERPDLVAHGLRGMGYRLVPIKAELPKAVIPGEKFVLNLQWINRAAGRALRDYSLRVRIVNDHGKVVVAKIENPTLPTSRWLQGESHVTLTEVVFPTVHGTGRADLQISLYDPLTDSAISMPLSNGTDDGFYPIGEVSLSS
jgi:hypothetical protein